ncbi:MAG: efflux transporter outer membrane subunit [Undibacterium sp.]|nr:efflux transporter outer membrane subunit [Undibacterium sp.]
MTAVLNSGIVTIARICPRKTHMVLPASATFRLSSLAALCLSGILAACGTSTTKIQGTLRASTTGQWEAPLPGTENTLALAQWWDSWNDPLMRELQAHAQQHSPSIAQAAARITQARAEASAAGATLWPSLDFTASITSNRDYPIPTGGKQTIRSTGLDARWEIDLFGANSAARNSMVARMEARGSEWHDARISLAAEVANTYVALRSCEAQADAAKQIALSQQVSQRLQEQRVVAGFLSPLDLAQQRVLLANADSREQQQQVNCAVLIKSLVVLIDLPEAVLKERLKTGRAALPQAGNFIVDSLPANTLLKRPDIRASMQNLVASAREIDAAQARRYPSISLLGNINLLGIRIAGQSTDASNWSFGPALTLPLFDAGKRKADVELAQARHAEALAAFRYQTLMAVREVEESLIRLDLVNREIQQHQHIETLHTLSMQSAQAGWELGSLSLLEKEEAQRQQLAGQQQKWQLQRDRASAWIALYKAVGGDWTIPGDQP